MDFFIGIFLVAIVVFFMLSDMSISPTPRFVSGWQKQGLDEVNKFRRQTGAKPLRYNKSKQACANQSATMDARRGFHATFRRCGERSQCEARGSDVVGSVAMFQNEGPGGGHFDIMHDPQFTQLTIGRDGSFFTFNFY